jgi:hypothetical protein
MKNPHDFKVGEQVTYFPLNADLNDNRHWGSVMVGVADKRIKVIVRTPDGDKCLSASPDRLCRQPDFPYFEEV